MKFNTKKQPIIYHHWVSMLFSLQWDVLIIGDIMDLRKLEKQPQMKLLIIVVVENRRVEKADLLEECLIFKKITFYCSALLNTQSKPPTSSPSSPSKEHPEHATLLNSHNPPKRTWSSIQHPIFFLEYFIFSISDTHKPFALLS